MITKKPINRRAGGFLKIVFLLELVGGCGAYAVWHRMNVSQDFRYYMNGKFPRILNWYYTMGESMNSDIQTRSIDQLAWATEKKLDV